MLPGTTKGLVLGLHAATPVVRLAVESAETAAAGWRPDAQRANDDRGPSDNRTAALVVRHLINSGLLMSQRSLASTSDKSLQHWRDPKALRALNPTQRRLLRALVLDTEFDSDVGQFVISKQQLSKAVFARSDSSSTLDPEVSRLRGQLGIQGAVKSTDGGLLHLDPTIVRVDWFEVHAGLLTAMHLKDHYQRAHGLFMAELAWVQSFRLTPEADVQALERQLAIARTTPTKTAEQVRILKYVGKVVTTRWDIRRRYLAALSSIGHTDRMILEYRLWRRAYDNDLQHAAGNDNGEPRDAFFGFADISLPDAMGGTRPSLEALGTIPLQINGIERPLADWAHRRKATNGVRASPDVLDRLKERIDSRQGNGVGPMDVTWPEMRALAGSIAHQLARARGRDGGQSLPVFDVLVAVGRHGCLLSTALCEILGTRLMGTLAMSRYLKGDNETSAYIRGVELPLVNARRVLLCDDVIKSGRTVDLAIRDIISEAYPKAEIHVAAFLAHDETIQVKQPSKKSLHSTVEWWAGLSIDLRRSAGANSWASFTWGTLE